MLFNSWTFIIFLALVLPVYYALSRRYQNIFLVIASYIFYGWWDYRFLSLILISTLVDYFAALGIQSSGSARRRRGFLLLSLCTNLGILGFFKYCDFFIGSFTTAMGSIGLSSSPVFLRIILPVGISFYTFQTMAYTIDVYRGKQRATRDFISFALYVCYFPQLVAGPIERSQHLLPQIMGKRSVSTGNLSAGLQYRPGGEQTHGHRVDD